MSKKHDDDEDIDYSDIPELDENFWRNAVVHNPKPKHSLTIRIDDDIVQWFKSQGPRYQTHINAVLKSYVQQQKNKDHSPPNSSSS